MIATFRKIKDGLHEFKAQENGTMYQGTLRSQPSGRGSTLTSVDSYPDLGSKEGILISKFVGYLKNR
ncbi:hypothetical protein [Aureispira anguillae]|uniref:Uncharacterized protein n=1 Tax=Aureispira anguillae TaxID=2864201 RepID=A0A916DT52_9BACT|nr:hypothetical protein [Aureispira anguillae]BDS12321.1 hypothetical protein AsAng_0030420 [Aureispira anguillae]